ncbi:MAG: glutamate synthase subunit beta [Rikenellaceae bacterium]
MGNPKAFLTIKRKEAGYRPVHERILDFGEVEQTLNEEDRQLQASRCMDCGVPFCHWSCPLGNKQPEWQDLIYKGKWKEAAELLLETDDFPEFTGRICPALCEKGCVLNKTNEAVTIRENEVAIIEKAFAEGYITPFIPKERSGKRVAVIGSGPSGLACANQLNRMGHSVTLFEKDEAAGGLLRLGIPDFKLNKNIIDRRISLMEKEGVEFRYNVNVGVGVGVSAQELLDNYDAICVTIGSGVPRDLATVEGRNLKGVHFALEYLQQQNRVVAGQHFSKEDLINAKGKHVLVIGGGDTGSDCIGTATRQGALKVTQIEIMPKPPVENNPDTPWPYFPIVLKTSSSHKEGCERFWSLDTKRFVGEDGVVKEVEVTEVEWVKEDNGRMSLTKTNNHKTIKADLVFLAMGFVNPLYEGLLEQLGVDLSERKNIAIDKKNHSSVDKVFAAGDAAMGASLVVRAIASGRDAAKGINEFLKE